MYLHGEVLSREGHRVGVHILTKGLRIPEKTIGEDVRIMQDGVVIDGRTNDMFDVLQPRSATVSLLCRDWIPELFGTQFRDCVINITVDDRLVFAGYIEPQVYSQPYNGEWDSLELNCIDALSALTLSRYRDAGAAWVDFGALCRGAATRSMLDIVTEIVAGVAEPLDITGRHPWRLVCDGSRLSGEGGPDALEGCGVNELLFLGADEEDTWSQSDTLTAILRWLDLHMVQTGTTFVVYSWQSQREGGIPGVVTSPVPVTDITVQTAWGADTQISIGEVYNRISVTCDIKAVETAVGDPLDSDDTGSPYRNRQMYMSEGIVDCGAVEGSPGGAEMWGWANDSARTRGTLWPHAGLSRREWMIRVMTHPDWVFYRDGVPVDLPASGQHNAATALATGQGAGLVRWSMAEYDHSGTDTSPVNTVSDTDALVISVNGDGKDYPDSAALLASVPRAEFVGGTASGNLTPSDDETTNYVVFSGNIVLNTTDSESLREPFAGAPSESVGPGGNLVWRLETRDGAQKYIARAWWGADSPSDTPAEVHPAAGIFGRDGLLPFTDDYRQYLQYSYNSQTEASDTIDMVPVIACMLIIGDRCLVETTRRGARTLEWQDYRSREECAGDDDYYSQSFTLGFDPKIGDYVVGQRYPIANNIDYTMGINATGTAVPVRRSDGVSGAVRFMILGPVNLTWQDVVRRHPTWFRPEQFTAEAVRVLPMVSNIQIENFEIKVYSDNALAEPLGDEDLVYISDNGERFVNTKDDITFTISSALTAEEREALGVREQIALSTAIDMATGRGVAEIWRDGAPVKPETAYVREYYEAHRRPTVSMIQSVKLDYADHFRLYRHPAWPDRLFHPLGYEAHCLEDWAEMQLREVVTDG